MTFFPEEKPENVEKIRELEKRSSKLELLLEKLLERM